MTATTAVPTIPDSLRARIPRASSSSLPAPTLLREDHLDAPPPALAEPFLAAVARGFATGFERWGYPIGGFDPYLVDGWLYLAERPITDLSELGRRLTRVEDVADLAELRATARRWRDETLPAFDARRRALAAVDPAALPDIDLASLVVDVLSFLVDITEARFADTAPMNLLTAALLHDAPSHGLTVEDAAALLAGSSAATTATTAASHDARLDDDAFLTEHGDEPLSTDLLQPTLAERPQLAADLRARNRAGAAASSAGPRAVPAEPDLHPGLAAALADARLAQDVRESGRGQLHLTQGRLRRVALAAGARLADRGIVAEASDAILLAAEELISALTDPACACLVDICRDRRAELDAARACAPAAMLGVAPEGPPPLGALPPGAARVFTLAMQWLDAMNGPPMTPCDPASADVLVGVAASPGIVEGHVRVVHDVDDLVDVEPGAVLVCAMTSPAWSAVLASCAAVVSDMGGLASHPAITARDLAIPAVVGTRWATTVLRDGERVRVDGTSGRVERLP